MNIRLEVLVKFISESNYEYILKSLINDFDYKEGQIITSEKEVVQLKKDIENILKDDDYDPEEFTLSLSNNDGEGILSFYKDNNKWEGHWDEWNYFDYDSSYKPEIGSYMGYLNKKDIIEWLQKDGFENITEIE